MKQQVQLAVVGGGASGLLCAAKAAQALGGEGVCILEAGKRVGTKLLATGNGRCNLTNMRAAPEHYHGDAAEAAPILAAYPPARVLETFRELGLLFREEGEGRVYPYSMQASSVLNLLRGRLQALGVEECCEFEVCTVRREGGGFRLTAADGRSLWARRCVLAAGGKSQSKFTGYELARQLGHSVTPLRPGLCPIFVREQKRALALKGVRALGAVTLLRGEREVARSSGEIQFTAQGLSGICIFELARFARPDDVLSLDLAPDLDAAELRFAAAAAGGSLQGVLPKALAAVCTPESCRDLRFTVAQTAPFQNAQVTAGGVPMAEVTGRCASKKAPGLWLLGELLNVDGDCGGFNLHWAWATALAAAEELSGEVAQ